VLNIGSGQLVKDASGNVGIGVTPSAWGSFYKAIESSGASAFAISSANVNPISLLGNAYATNSNFIYKTTGAAAMYEAGNVGSHRWFIAPSGTAGNTISFTTAMSLNSSGQLTVGSTSLPFPSGGRINSVTGASNQAIVTSFSGADGASVGIWSNYANTTGGAYHMYFTYNQVNVGVISSTSTTTTYTTSSDYRLKDITGAVTGAEAKDFIMALQPKQGTWKADGSKFVGFLAHEFQVVSPSSVNGEKDAVDKDGNPEYQGMQAASSEVMANLIALVQELTARLEVLENK
jgi:hypothetical protein